MVIQFCKFLNSVSTCRSWLCPLLHSGLDSDRFLSELPYNLVICHSDNPFGLRTKSVQQCVAWKNDQTSDIHNTKQSRVVQKYVKHHSMRYCVRWVRYAVNSNVINHQAAAVIRKKNAQKYWEKKLLKLFKNCICKCSVGFSFNIYWHLFGITNVK